MQLPLVTHMVGAKSAFIMAVAALTSGSFFASPVPEAIAAVIATDAVGAAELQGVTKLIFGKCVLNSGYATADIPPGAGFFKNCSISGVDDKDFAVASVG